MSNIVPVMRLYSSTNAFFFAVSLYWHGIPTLKFRQVFECLCRAYKFIGHDSVGGVSLGGCYWSDHARPLVKGRAISLQVSGSILDREQHAIPLYSIHVAYLHRLGHSLISN